MPRITAANYRVLLKIFLLFGCIYKRKKGSHHILNYPGAKRAVVIPENAEGDSIVWIIDRSSQQVRYQEAQDVVKALGMAR